MTEPVTAALQAELQRWRVANRLWVAYSGGLDSHVLLHACMQLRAALSLELRALHIDHGLHPQSAQWADHCRAVCAALDVSFVEHRVQVDVRRGDGLEAAARSARYRAVAGVIGPGETVATAHHLDDQAESLLLALLRGSGVHGLAGMPVRAPLGDGHLLRPLLAIERAALADYARRHRLEWLDDPSNHELGFDRNRLREQVMPLLRERWPAAARTIARSAAHCGDAAENLDACADAQLPMIAGTAPGALSVQGLLARRRREALLLLRRWIGLSGFRLPSSAHLNRIWVEVLNARVDAAPLVAWPGCEVRRYRDDLFALSPLPHAPAGSIDWLEGPRLELPCALGWLERRRDVPLPLSVRFGGPGGASCVAPGRPRRPLAKLFQEVGIPSWLRPLVPRVFAQDGRLLLVPEVCGCALPVQSVRWRGHPWGELGWLDPSRTRRGDDQ